MLRLPLRLRLRLRLRPLLGVLLGFAALGAMAQTAAPSVQAHGHLLLVLPFENQSSQPNLDWIGEAAADILNRRLNSAGFLTIGRGDRLYALDRLGLPVNFQPSRATTIRIAQTLDADDVVVGSFQVAGANFSATARILDINELRMGAPIAQQAALKDLLATLNGLAWEVARQLDPTYSVAKQTFLAADGTLPPTAFENYIRGMTAESASERVVHLREAVRLDPGFPPAWEDLGHAYFANQDYENAAATFGRLPADDPDALEADFYRGLALFYTGHYMQAEDAFAFVSRRLPLPEVVNNEGVAASRRGRDGAPLFEQAIAADARDPDYHFNLAIALRKRNDVQGAIREIDTTLKLHALDTEAQGFANALRNPGAVPVNLEKGKAILDKGKAIPDDTLPLERIKRSYNETEFRQAAFELEQMQQARLAMLPAAQQAASLIADGTQFLNRGLILEAEREYQAALRCDPSSAQAHAGLAAVREHSGNATAAREEAIKSLSLSPNVDAHLVLARLDLESNLLPAAASQVSQALVIDPVNANAKGMKRALASRGQQVP
jgi:tetratricopeptide (TPR) repeat protein